jgi:hypothetical protein
MPGTAADPACCHLPCAADANILVNTCRLQAQRYLFTYQEPIPVEQLVRGLCDTKQGYTQYGGLRPFGVSLLYAGWYVPGAEATEAATAERGAGRQWCLNNCAVALLCCLLAHSSGFL